ncbi:MAG TPA: response regulator [Rhizomicrobium sp.]|jgi:two-component system chemotaxis response regulator CheY
MPEGPKVRALVVDDAGLVRAYYRDILERHNYQVDEALNGLEAMEKLLQDRFDFVIVDVNMPQMDGISFLKVLRRQSLPLASIPAIVISTEAEAHDSAGARAAGANHYLVKPLREDGLVQYAALLSGRPA